GERARQRATDGRLYGPDQDFLVFQARQIDVAVEVLPQVLQRKLRFAVPDVFLEIAIKACRAQLGEQPFLGHEFRARPREQPVLRWNLARYPPDISLSALLRRIMQITPRLLEAGLHRFVRFGQLRLGKRAIALGKVEPVRVADNLTPSQSRADGAL